MIWTRLYYRYKRFIPHRVRLFMRRIYAGGILRRSGSNWPIQESAGEPPKGWPGWPDGKKFALVLTHDVEGPRGLAKCREIALLEKSLGFRSSFNFIPEGSYRVPQPLLDWLAASGFEVGVHDLHHDGKLFGSRDAFRAKAQKINGYLRRWNAVGFRSGFMLRNLDWIADLNLEYDASTFDTDPFEPQPDGLGSIFPVWMEAPHGRGFMELPYTLPQDSTLFLLFRQQNIDLWLRKLDWIAEHGGMALVNIHPDYLNLENKPGALEYPVRFIEELLQIVLTKYRDQCWHALPREVARHVLEARQRSPRPSQIYHRSQDRFSSRIA